MTGSRGSLISLYKLPALDATFLVGRRESAIAILQGVQMLSLRSLRNRTQLRASTATTGFSTAVLTSPSATAPIANIHKYGAASGVLLPIGFVPAPQRDLADFNPKDAHVKSRRR